MGIIKFVWVSLVTLSFWSVVSFAETSKSPQISNQDEKILKKLSQGSLEEVQLGDLAQRQASNSAVKDFGKRMSQDHTLLKKQVDEFAARQGLSLSVSKNQEGKAMRESLARRSGIDFDRHYIQDMLEDHQKDIAELQEYWQTSQNPELKKMTKGMLNTLENHIRIAENVAGKIGVSPEKGLNQPEYPS